MKNGFQYARTQLFITMTVCGYRLQVNNMWNTIMYKVK